MSEKTLAGRKAMVTGGARGIGAAIAEALTKAGASVMIGDILADLGKETAGRLAKTGAKTGFVELNVTDDAEWEKAVAATIATLGGYDILINNAGIEITSLVVDLRAEDLRRMCDVNVVGTGLGMKHAFRAMRPGGGAGAGGTIVNIASVAATIAFPAIAGYSGTKSAVDRMTRVAAMEAGKLGYGVRINCLYPGLVPTDMGMQLANDIVAAGLAPDVGAAVRCEACRRRLAGWARSATWPTPLFSFAPTRRASSLVLACRSTAVWACKSPNAKNRNSGGSEYEREETCHRLWRLRLHGASGL